MIQLIVPIFYFSMPQFLSNLPSSWKLASHNIHLWAVSLAPQPYDYSLLSEDEREKAQRFHFEKHRRRYVNARKALRILLGKYLACSPSVITFDTHPRGKPYLSNHAVYFNVSHSGEWALIGLCEDHEIGVDIEVYSARDYLGIARTAFSEEEQRILRQCPHFLRSYTFYSTWSQKEAFIKACGQGLYYPTQSFTVSPYSASPVLIREENGAQNWQIQPFMFRCEISAALCYPSNYTPRLHWFDYSLVHS